MVWNKVTNLRPGQLVGVGCLILAPLAAWPVPGRAATDIEQILEVIEQQQQQLEAQKAQIAEQQRALQALRREVESLRSRPPAEIAHVHSTERPAAPEQKKANANQAKPAPAETTASADVTAPKASGPQVRSSAPQEDWPGAFELPGTDTQIKLSGFVELDAIHDSDAIGTPSAFVTSAIATTDKTAAEGADGQTNFSVQASRLVLETKTPIADHQVKTFVSADWFGDFSSTSPSFHLRQGYVEVSDTLFGGDLLIGQAWSTVTDLDAAPNVLDFQGPNALFGERRPLLRWTRDLAPKLSVKLAAEAPDLRFFEGAEAVSRWPDAIVALDWQTRQTELMATMIARDLRATAGTGPGTVDAVGWGASLQGKVQLPGALQQDFATFALTYGEGVAGLVNDEPADASYNPLTGKLEPIPTLAWMATYQHRWSPKLYSVASYGEVEQDTLSFQAPDAFRKTRYASANLSWTPLPQWLLGVEILYGSRKDKDGADGSDVRTQFTSRFSFP